LEDDGDDVEYGDSMFDSMCTRRDPRKCKRMYQGGRWPKLLTTQDMRRGQGELNRVEVRKKRLSDVALKRDDGGREPRGNERIRCATATLIGARNVVHVCARRNFRSFNMQKRSRSGISFANLGKFWEDH
jgi:hypothetical protein